MLVHARADAMESAMQALRLSASAEIHETGVPGKFAAVLECAHERELADCIERVQALPGVLSVSMTSHYIEDAAALSLEMPE
jgi:nitrate reductase NapAB chaperone NapD